MSMQGFVEARSHIQRYGDGGFTIDNETRQGSQIVMADHCQRCEIEHIDALGAEHLQSILAKSEHIEILLIGCGQTIVPLKQEIKQVLNNAGISVDVMDTGAACRTYNILMSEERRVAALLVAV